MPRYMVERKIPSYLHSTIEQPGVQTTRTVAEHNFQDGVTWLHSYVSPDRKRTFCIYDGPTPEAVRRAADRNAVPVHAITEVRVMAPYIFR
jgi:hypothetical protein